MRERSTYANHLFGPTRRVGTTGSNVFATDRASAPPGSTGPSLFLLPPELPRGRSRVAHLPRHDLLSTVDLCPRVVDRLVLVLGAEDQVQHLCSISSGERRATLPSRRARMRRAIPGAQPSPISSSPSSATPGSSFSAIFSGGQCSLRAEPCCGGCPAGRARPFDLLGMPPARISMMRDTACGLSDEKVVGDPGGAAESDSTCCRAAALLIPRPLHRTRGARRCSAVHAEFASARGSISGAARLDLVDLDWPGPCRPTRCGAGRMSTVRVSRLAPPFTAAVNS